MAKSEILANCTLGETSEGPPGLLDDYWIGCIGQLRVERVELRLCGSFFIDAEL